MTADVSCNRNKFGYCKFGETCKLLHINELCWNGDCDERCCSFRHPKECMYFKNTELVNLENGANMTTKHVIKVLQISVNPLNFLMKNMTKF